MDRVCTMLPTYAFDCVSKERYVIEENFELAESNSLAKLVRTN